ncbi:MAG: YaaA family protein [Sulfurimonadaceae bacterium]|jgi:cytoplasmic iron level regulating protein YaaA (DUF328/UPF0246 family)|nr:YaaA family protein [Sulfurimonadaceae bacterium]
MLKILFSPAEGKREGGSRSPSELLGSRDARASILQKYNEIILSGDTKTICELFGLKKESDCEIYQQDIFTSPHMDAIERYTGVAYEYLNYLSLEDSAQEYLRKHCIIFSNLYGPILGGDAIANYKVSQGNKIGAIAPEKFYKDRFSYQLDLFLGNDEILDLRAGYYDKFYDVKTPYTTLKFLKNGKTVSHWAKAYRGIVLREIAKNNITSLEEFQKLEIENLTIKEMKIIKNKTEIIYDIKE